MIFIRNSYRKKNICFALSVAIPVQLIMKCTGRHSDYKAMKPYTDVQVSIKVSAMSKLNET